MNQISYYIRDLKETLEDAKHVKNITGLEGDLANPELRDYYLENLARDAAEYEYDNCDGWEWMDAENPFVLSLVIDGKDAGDFKVSMDYEPIYCAEKVEEDGSK